MKEFVTVLIISYILCILGLYELFYYDRITILYYLYPMLILMSIITYCYNYNRIINSNITISIK